VRIAIGADDHGPLTGALIAELERRDATVERFGVLAGGAPEWASTGREVAEAVARGAADLGIVCCWTGTGVSIAANKIAGVRAALCADAATAAGARKWNDANVLALSLRSTTPVVGLEILEAFLGSEPSDEAADKLEIAKLDALDERRRRAV
jgi:ribose 5-phosphate isomerase B